MNGTVIIYVKNGDLFSDSYDAVMQLICLIPKLAINSVKKMVKDLSKHISFHEYDQKNTDHL